MRLFQGLFHLTCASMFLLLTIVATNNGDDVVGWFGYGFTVVFAGLFALTCVSE